ncbi:BspA family leucine-rich repeat surface protein [bacterium 1xD42-87]|nr:BspA family leucine-rich repeat surface protein [bacterium 1xD42-87]
MKDLSGRKADVAATVTHSKTYWSSENVANAYEETQNCVSAPDLTAGTWEGTFQVEIRLETNVVQDEEETAPAEAYNDWNYTLDEENNIITLNYYIGLDYANPKKDVIVYANYVIDGKTYKTQIKSNDVNATVNTAYMFNNNFNYAQYIETIQFSGGIDMSNVTNMSYMFNSCTKLTSVDFGTDFNTKNVTNMAQMFNNCTSLTSLDVSDFDTSNVTNMSGMFSSCRALTDLDLSNFDTSKVTDMQSMFSKCVLLTSLDLGNFNTGNVMNMNYMFWDSSKLKTIYVTEGNWSSSQATTTWMFQNCGTSEVTYK